MSNGPLSVVKCKHTGCVVPTTLKWVGGLAYTFGSRTDEICHGLMSLLTPFTIRMTTSDNLGSYAREVPRDKHLTGKLFTQ